MQSTVTRSQTGSVLIDVEVYDASFNKVFQQFWDNQPFLAGQTRTFVGTWSAPATAATGTYTVMVGEFSNGWGTFYNWNANAATFNLN
jgi:hypothetical protein